MYIMLCSFLQHSVSLEYLFLHFCIVVVVVVTFTVADAACYRMGVQCEIKMGSQSFGPIP